MPQKILFITDLHKRDTDPTNIKGRAKVNNLIQADIINFIHTNKITHVVIGGDWYDKGYAHAMATLSDNQMDRNISEAVNGNCYIVLGNHFYLERDNNPEMYAIQPCDLIKPINPVVTGEKPIFKAARYFRVGPVQVSLFHYDKHDKEYYQGREEGVTHHIGVYHDDTVLPSFVRAKSGYGGTTSTVYMESVYNNIDIAILNHIHVAIGVEYLQLGSGKKIPLMIPGALGITSNEEKVKHKSVHLPVITVNDDNTVVCTMHPFSTHMDMLKFYDKREAKININATSNATSGLSNEEINKILNNNQTLSGYLYERGYDERHIKLIRSALSGGLDVLKVIDIMREEEGTA